MSDLGNKEVMARNIKKYMKLNKKTRIDICKELEVPYSTVSDWINAVTYPRIDKIEKLANYFGIEKSALVEGPINNDEKLDETITVISRIAKKMTEEEKDKMIDILKAVFNDKFVE